MKSNIFVELWWHQVAGYMIPANIWIYAPEIGEETNTGNYHKAVLPLWNINELPFSSMWWFEILILGVSSRCVSLNTIDENQTIVFHPWVRVQRQGTDAEMKSRAQYQTIQTVLFYLVLKHFWVTQSVAVHLLGKVEIFSQDFCD